jgi:abortive infection bacteriophage resistance protein
MKYEKPPLPHRDLLNVLVDRGLTIKNKDRAIRYLKSVGYFRLSGYMYHLQSKDGHHIFVKGTTFNDIVLHYNFDKKLRVLTLEYLERIEVSLRAKLTDYYSLSYGFFWYSDKNLYQDEIAYEMIMDEITERYADPRDKFLKAYKDKYTEESLPPSNMALETLTFGKLARLYKGLKNREEKKQIANDFNLVSPILSSWLVYLNNVRNVCAHHSRLWNRRITADRWKVPRREKFAFKGDLSIDFNTSYYGAAALIQRLLTSFNPDNAFISKLTTLIEEYSPTIDTSSMGFRENWQDNPTW